jgi:two-component system, NarL family, sensor kinase
MSMGAVFDGLASGHRPLLQPFAALLATAGAYYAGAEAAFAIGTLTQQFAPFWPPNVVLLCAFLMMPPRRWPAVVIACLPMHILAERGVDMPAFQLLAAFGCNVTVALLNAVALTWFLSGREWFSGLGSTVIYLNWTVVVNPALVACVAALEPILGNGSVGEYGQFWWRWYLSNALGNLTLAPMFLTWAPYAMRHGWRLPTRRRQVEAIVLMAGLAISCALAFELRPIAATTDLFPALLYLPVPFLLAIAVRLGAKGASAAIVIFTLAVLGGAMRGHDPLAAANYSVVAIQLFLAETAVPVMLLAALVEELRRSNKHLALALEERNQAEMAATATQALLQSSLDALGTRFAILDGSGRILATNTAWDDAAHLVAQSGERYFVGRNYLDECGRGRPHQRQIAAGLRRVVDGELAEFWLEYQSDFIAGRWYQVRGTRFVIEREPRLVVTHEDITEVKRSEDALRRLSGRLMRAQDESRRQIARELHDATAQNLLAATLGIGQALRLAPRLTQAVTAMLEESRALIDQSQREIRTVAYLLHPPMLDEAGLSAALRWLSDGFSKRTEIEVALDLAEDIGRLAAEGEAALFRVAQEALTNVHRHSGSRTARIELKRVPAPERGSLIVMAVEDQGRGMPAAFAPLVGDLPHDRYLGIGLTGMRERLHHLGGSLRIDWGAGGTTVRATIPDRASQVGPAGPTEKTYLSYGL